MAKQTSVNMTGIPKVINIGKDAFGKGVLLPVFGIGTFKLDENSCVPCVSAALKAGYRLIDTAAIYQNEGLVRQAIAESGVPRSEIFITTKLRPHDQGTAAYNAALKSLERLGVDYVDLYLVHWPGVSKTPLDSPELKNYRKDTWLALQRLYYEGKTRSIGVSNFTPYHLDELCNAEWCTVRPSVNQFELHPLLQQRDIQEACKRYGIAIQAYSSLAQGNAKLFEHEALLQIAHRKGCSVGDVLLRWGIQSGFSVIPRSSKAERVLSNMTCLDDKCHLTQEEMDTITNLEEGHRLCWNPFTVS